MYAYTNVNKTPNDEKKEGESKKNKYEGKDKFNKKMDFMSIKDEILKITSMVFKFILLSNEASFKWERDEEKHPFD